MSVLVLLWVGTLGVIYTSSYFEMKSQNQQMVKEHAERYNLPKEFAEQYPQGKPRGNKRPEPGYEDSLKFQLSTFYSVAVSDRGEILEIRNEQPTVHTDDELKALAQKIIEKDSETGTEGNLTFCKTDKVGYTVVAFMDNTVINQGAMTLLRYTVIFGGAALVLFFFLSVFLARKIVDPLEESYRKQKQFISDAGHELKTPVSVVSANADMLSREIGDNKWLQNIQYENERMGILVAQLLELARTENVKPQTEPVDFSRLVAGESLPFESVVFEKGLTLRTDISSGIFVEGNGTALKQVVSVLLDNAICHSRDGGEIRLSLKKEHGLALLSVINEGDEIPEEHLRQIFERFYRADTVRNSDDNRYGLGLAIAKAIVTSHKGGIEAMCYGGLVEFKAKIPLL